MPESSKVSAHAVEERARPPEPFVLDREFSNCLRKLTADEEQGLEKLLRENGCLSPLVVWDETNILLDGNNRARLCGKLNIPYEVRRISLPSREEALLWVLRHQRDKRNCTDGEKYAITREIRKLLVEQGRERQAHGQTVPGKTLLSLGDKSVGDARRQEIESAPVLCTQYSALSPKDRPAQHDTRQTIASEWASERTGVIGSGDARWNPCLCGALR